MGHDNYDLMREADDLAQKCDELSAKAPNWLLRTICLYLARVFRWSRDGLADEMVRTDKDE